MLFSFRLVLEKADLEELEPKMLCISILTKGFTKAQSELIFNYKSLKNFVSFFSIEKKC